MQVRAIRLRSARTRIHDEPGRSWQHLQDLTASALKLEAQAHVEPLRGVQNPRGFMFLVPPLGLAAGALQPKPQAQKHLASTQRQGKHSVGAEHIRTGRAKGSNKTRAKATVMFAFGQANPTNTPQATKNPEHFYHFCAPEYTWLQPNHRSTMPRASPAHNHPSRLRLRCLLASFTKTDK